MSQLSMTRTEREAFLADLHIGVLAVERQSRPPLVSPLWYRYTPGGAVEFTTEMVTEKAVLMNEVGRASMCVQKDEVPYAYVTVEGPVTLEPASRDVQLEIASRYLGAEGATAYVEASSDDTTVTLVPKRWHTVDFAKLEI